uniref:Tapasin n=1 Tax=Spermophilus dauricus TaxID=99837 RepID=A0A8C9Q9M6_SPEDA
MKPLSLLLAVTLGERTPRLLAQEQGPQDVGGGGLAKRPAALLLRQGPEGPPPRPDLDPKLYLKVDVVLTVLTHTPAPRIRLGQDAILDLSFAYMPPTLEATASLAPSPPPFGLEWRRQHLGKGHLLLAATPGLGGQMPAAREGAVAFAAWDDDDPWGPWTGNGTFWLPAVRPFQEGTYLATVHLPYLQGQVSLELTMHKPPKVSLSPAPLVWAAPGEAPPELLCLVSHFYPSEGLEVEWELRGGSESGSQKAEGQRWLSSLRHHSDGSVSLSGHLKLPPITAEQHGARYICRVHHSSLPASGRSAEVTVEVAGFSGPSLEDGVGLFLSAFLLLGLFKVLGWYCKKGKSKINLMLYLIKPKILLCRHKQYKKL